MPLLLISPPVPPTPVPEMFAARAVVTACPLRSRTSPLATVTPEVLPSAAGLPSWRVVPVPLTIVAPVYELAPFRTSVRR